MDRNEQIKSEAKIRKIDMDRGAFDPVFEDGFIDGAQWADANPPDEYGQTNTKLRARVQELTMALEQIRSCQHEPEFNIKHVIDSTGI